MLEGQRLRINERPRRLRRTASIRKILGETRLHQDMFVAPVFVVEGEGRVEGIEGMPEVFRYSIDKVSAHVERLTDLGIRSLILFGIPDRKDEEGTGAYSKEGVVPRAIRVIRSKFPDTVVMADVCLCEYTSHGHCGVLTGQDVDNDRTLPLLARAAVEYARAGADVVAPSAMMDGQVRAIRTALQDAAMDDILLMSYSAKHASAFYSPFRNAAESTPAFGDRRSYQMQPGNRREAIHEVELDINEGADIVMVKPALAYLDVIAEARRRFAAPVAAYNVSGEYAMLKAAAMNGWLDERSAVLEVLTSIRRSGADLIITYFAEDAARWLKEGW